MFPIQAGISCIWTNDSQRILLENFDAICNSPSYLYHSALPLSPSSSWFHKCYSLELSQDVKVVEGFLAEWGMCSRTVLLDSIPFTLSLWNDSIAVGSEHRDITILDTITGSQTAVLSSHTEGVRSLTFSSDGILLVSGSYDKTVKLWDVQTGGVIKTFYGHTSVVRSVSISTDHTIIASGSEDKTLRLWDIQVGDCHQVIEQQSSVNCVSFSPKSPKALMSVYGGTVQQWDIGSHKVGPVYHGYQIAFSPDGTQFISHTMTGVTIQNTNSGVTMAKFVIANSYFNPCCFSPDGRLVAVAAGYNVCVWDITGSHPHPVETFTGHTNAITSLVFSAPSTLISASKDGSIKFWQVGTLSTGPVTTNPGTASPTSILTRYIALEGTNDVIIPSDFDGVIGTWGISDVFCNGSPQTPAGDSHQMIDCKLIFVWYTDKKINIWDVQKGKPLQIVNVAKSDVMDLRVSGDGSKVFCLYKRSVQAWDILTGETVGEAGGMWQARRIITTDDSKVWVAEYAGIQGWDFGIPGSPPVGLSKDIPDMLYLNDTKVWEINKSRVKDIVTGKVVFQLPKRFGNPGYVQWGGQYLLIFFHFDEILVLDFHHILL